MRDYSEDPKYQVWANRVRKKLIPKIDQSQVVLSMVPTGKADVKFAVELGLSIMMDKPIVLAVQPGAVIPEHLVRVADDIVEVDYDDMKQAAKAIKDAMERIKMRANGKE